MPNGRAPFCFSRRLPPCSGSLKSSIKGKTAAGSTAKLSHPGGQRTAQSAAISSPTSLFEGGVAGRCGPGSFEMSLRFSES